MRATRDVPLLPSTMCRRRVVVVQVWVKVPLVYTKTMLADDADSDAVSGVAAGAGAGGPGLADRPRDDPWEVRVSPPVIVHVSFASFPLTLCTLPSSPSASVPLREPLPQLAYAKSPVAKA